MHAAANANPAQSFQQTTSPSQSADQIGIKVEEQYADDEFYEKANNQESSEVFESVQDQKLLNNAFDIISLIELSLQNNYEATNSENGEEKITFSYLSKLQDENSTQFKIQLPQILLPKMHFGKI